MTNVSVETVPRFSGRALALIGVVLAVLVTAAIGGLVAGIDLFGGVTVSTVVTTEESGTTTSTLTTTALTGAQLAVVVLLTAGALAVVGGIVLALADLTVAKGAAHAEAAPAEGGFEALGVEAAIKPVAELATALATALKDLRTSTALFVVGATLMVFGGVVAWQTAPTQPTPALESPATPTPAESSDAPTSP